MKAFGLCEKVYEPDEICYVIEKYIDKKQKVKMKKENAYVYNFPCAFDIETSSFLNEQNQKCACMYVWQLGLNGAVIVGRTWKEFFDVLSIIYEKLDLNKHNRLVIYVHNLSYEFQFICKRFNWIKTFALDNRKIATAISQEGFEFRCSYILSGVSLKKLGEDLVKYKVEKMSGDLDYSKIRNSRTPLTEKEMKYCVNDVKVVMSYIQEKIEKDGSIADILTTKTSYVRKLVQNNCLHGNKSHKKDKKHQKFSQLMRSLTLDVDEYEQLKRAFQGGFTHASSLWSGFKMEDVTSYDFTSSYPTVLIAERFPMSKSKLIEIKKTEEIEKYLDTYCCVFDVKFKNIKSKFIFDSYISSSKCLVLKGSNVNNGRVYSADELVTTITNVDFEIISKVYEWDEMKVANFRIYLSGYLPTDFVKTVVKLYKDKTELKDVEGREEDYQLSKANLNSTYGMIATDIARPKFSFSNGYWIEEEMNLEEQISKYNKDKKRCLFYAWAVFCTSYARRNLWTGIFECGSDYIYSDTDSVKITNAETHSEYFERYNRIILQKLKMACDFHKIPFEDVIPKTVEGIEKPLGVWDWDGEMKFFKTLGAKRYLVQYSNNPKNKKKKGKISLTVSGLNKEECLPYLQGKYDDVFEAFKNGLFVDSEHTGKNVHTYIDEERKGFVKDYLGNIDFFKEFSSVHLEGSEYRLGISNEYLSFLAFFGGAI